MKLKTLPLLVSTTLVSFTSLQEYGITQKHTGGNRSVMLQFATPKSKLELNTPTPLKITFENVARTNSYILGRGVSIKGGGEGYTKCEVTARKEALVDGHLEISIYERPDEKAILFHKFLIPVETAE